MTDQATAPLLDEMELEAIVGEVLDALLFGAGLDPDAPVPPETGLDLAPLTGSIAINADAQAKLVIESDTHACATLARCWGLIGDDGATITDAKDALGELCNLIGATAKTVFEEESFVGIPEVIEDKGPEWDIPALNVHHVMGTFRIRYGLV